MKRIKTKIRKFFGIDITRRKSLYNELIECYDLIDVQRNKINEIKNVVIKNNNEITSLKKEKQKYIKEIMDLNEIIKNYQNVINKLNVIVDELKEKVNELSANVKDENFKKEDEICLNDEYIPSDTNENDNYSCTDDCDYDCSSVVTDDCPLVCLADSCSYHCRIDWIDNEYNCSDDWGNEKCPCYTMGDYGPIDGDNYPYDEYNPSDDIHISFEVGCETFKK